MWICSFFYGACLGFCVVDVGLAWSGVYVVCGCTCWVLAGGSDC